MQVSGASVFAWFHLTRKNKYRYKTPYKNRAFILESYLVLFGFFIISQFLRFVNMCSEIYIITFREVKKSLPCVRGGGAACRDGGVVKGWSYTKTIPQSASLTAPFTQGSLFCSPITCRFSLQALHLCPQTQNTAYLFRDIPYFEKCPLEWRPNVLGFLLTYTTNPFEITSL